MSQHILVSLLQSETRMLSVCIESHLNLLYIQQYGPEWEIKMWSVQFAVCSVHCVVCSVQYVVFSVLCVVCSVQCAECSVQKSVLIVQCAECSLQFEVCSVQCAVCGVQCRACSLQFAVCNVQCAVCSEQCKMWSVACAVCSVQCEFSSQKHPSQHKGWKSATWAIVKLENWHCSTLSKWDSELVCSRYFW